MGFEPVLVPGRDWTVGLKVSKKFRIHLRKIRDAFSVYG